MIKTGIIQNNQSTTMLLNKLKSDPKQYPPLNKKQEQALIKKYKKNRDKLNELLYMHNIRLAFNMAKRYATKTPDFDSLVSDCLYGLAVACQRFDTSKNIKFSTYATNWIFKYCLSSFYSKQNEIDKVSISLSSASRPKKSNSNNEVTFENYINDYIDPTVAACQTTIDQQLSADDRTVICNNLIQSLDADTSLSAIDKAVFIECFYSRSKTKEIAEKYKMTSQNVTQIKNKVLSKFKDILASEYDITSYSNALD